MEQWNHKPLAVGLYTTDDIILSCNSIKGLNRMFKICSFFANSNHITFNCKKTVCIKFGGKTHDYEYLRLNGNDIE